MQGHSGGQKRSPGGRSSCRTPGDGRCRRRTVTGVVNGAAQMLATVRSVGRGTSRTQKVLMMACLVDEPAAQMVCTMQQGEVSGCNNALGKLITPDGASLAVSRLASSGCHMASATVGALAATIPGADPAMEWIRLQVWHLQPRPRLNLIRNGNMKVSNRVSLNILFIHS